ncbi:hypothetical protein MMC20_007756 [Loxospora ochrophaea]|nr:hypothetical protein [Loxospora ochrophaea]
MFSPRPRHQATAEYHKLQVPFSKIGDDWEADSCSQERGETPYKDKQERLLHQQSPPSLGKPTKKKKIHILDVLVTLLSLLCLVIAIVTVANESISWRLGVGNRQLIVVGFLLSIMNLCLGSLTPTLFLLLEAKFGPSTIQNYDGILRNQPLSSKLSLAWRMALGLMLALPLGLSAAYKNFSGSESTKMVDAMSYTGNESYYGMFGPPGLQSLGEKTGISLFFNATLPFAVASPSINGSDPPLPTCPQAYGFNVLLLNNESTAMLDIPQPSYISAVQSLLAGGESWNITAQVIATVATFNNSRAENEAEYLSYLKSFCQAGQESSGAYTHQSLMNDWSVVLLDHASPGDQSLQYIGLLPDPGIEDTPTCSNFSGYAQVYDMNRQLCNGTWSITRGGIELVEGSCTGVALPSDKQLVITSNTLFLGVWYMMSLAEFLGPFATTRNQSTWEGPYMATGMAAMLWSRITALDSVADHDNPHVASGIFAGVTYEDTGLIYPVNDTVVYIRPTLRKSSLLYAILMLQPLLIFVILGLKLTFHSIPLDKGFGLISILSGIERGSLDTLAGAALSGELQKAVRLVMRPVQDEEKGIVEYQVTTAPQTGLLHNGKLVSRVVYH